MSAIRSLVIAIIAGVWVLAPVSGVGPAFVPDWTFKGSTLNGWRVVGEAGWTAQNGELIGKPKPAGGGWLMLDRSYQDVNLFTSFRCTGGCKTGVLLRAEKTPEGWKGIYVSLSEGDTGSFQVVLNAQGQEVERKPLRMPGGIVRVAPPPSGEGAARRGFAPPAGGMMLGRGGPVLPLVRTSPRLKPGEWNDIELVLDANIVRYTLNGGGRVGGATDESANGYGPIALYAGGAGEVRFRSFAFKDLAVRVTPIEQTSSRFRAQRICDMFYSWSAAAADFNRDGYMDIVAGPNLYYGPDFTKWREIYLSSTLSPSKEFPDVNGQFAFDYTGDGWPDVVVAPPRGVLYVNPGNESRRWERYDIFPNVQSESALAADVDGDGRPEIVLAISNHVGYAKPGPEGAAKPWIVHRVSEAGYGNSHGIGAGDINGDGRVDILNPFGWWEQPPAGSAEGPWKCHSQPFGWARRSIGGANIYVYDVNGDGLNDVVTSMDAHGSGLGWYEQKRDAGGAITFVEHIISEGFGGKNAGGVAFTQPHATALADIDGDGIPDFIAGKRYWSHLETTLDPDGWGTPVLYWYRTVRNPKAPGGAEFVPELIHNRSGGGSDILAADLNGDGAVDVVTSTNRGTFVFWNRPRGRAARPTKPAGK